MHILFSIVPHYLRVISVSYRFVLIFRFRKFYLEVRFMVGCIVYELSIMINIYFSCTAVAVCLKL